MEKPDWELWLGLPKVSAKEALILSFDICPYDFDSLMGWQAYEKSLPSTFEKDLYKRQRLFEAALKGRTHFPTANLSDDLGNSEVSLSEFSNWAINEMKLADLPAELIELAEKFTFGAPAPATAPIESSSITRLGKRTWDDRALLQLLDESRAFDMTHDKLAERHGVKRQRITYLLKKARDIVTPRKSVWDNALKASNSKK